ncbi:unnamed protein product [Rotaria sordida]|uniref:Uncharacterized protein n=1 Tax=Rotaria sordida TaxID=392033 RepID=A0A814HB28_9BILA|nr:unnamed protein product [Rotaria sordida]
MFNIYFERPPTIVVCKHCGEDYDEDDYYTRKVTILQRNYRKQDAANRNQNSSLLINYNKNDYMIDVSYQSSDKLIETNNSYSQYQKFLEEQKRCKIRKSVVRIMCDKIDVGVDDVITSVAVVVIAAVIVVVVEDDNNFIVVVVDVNDDDV